MNHARFKALVDAYGGDPKRWPEAERSDALALCERDASLQHHIDNASLLDDWLGRSVMTSRLDIPLLVADLPDQPGVSPLEQRLGRVLDWLLPKAAGRWWQPAVAALLPVGFGLMLTGASWLDVLADDWSSAEQRLFAGPSVVVAWLEVDQ